MASSVLVGQTALCALPPAPVKSRGQQLEETMATYTLPVQLKIAESQKRKKGTAAGVLGNGMDVYKVSKVRISKRLSRLRCVKLSGVQNHLTNSTPALKLSVGR